jgi:hypothetical protein
MADEPTAEPDDDLARAYVRGDFARVRELAAAQLAADGVSDATRQRARDYRERMVVDPWVYGGLGFALAVFCGLVLRYGP